MKIPDPNQDGQGPRLCYELLAVLTETFSKDTRNIRCSTF
jgi:hypothetical protein